MILFSWRGSVVLLGKHSNLVYIFLHSQVPYYTTQNIVFDIVPSKLSFTVNYRSVVFKVSSHEFRNQVYLKLDFNIIWAGEWLLASKVECLVFLQDYKIFCRKMYVSVYFLWILICIPTQLGHWQPHKVVKKCHFSNDSCRLLKVMPTRKIHFS